MIGTSIDSRNGPLMSAKVKMPQTTPRSDLIINIPKPFKEQKLVKITSGRKFKSNYLNSLKKNKGKENIDTNILPHTKKKHLIISRKKTEPQHQGRNRKKVKHVKVKSNIEFNCLKHSHPI